MARFEDWCLHAGFDPRGASLGVTASWVRTVLTYASFTRAGGWNDGESVTEPNVRSHLRGISAFYARELLPDPLVQPGFNGARLVQLSALLKSFSAADSPVQHKNPIPASVVLSIRHHARHLPMDCVPSLDSLLSLRIADLCEIAFLLLLRPSEYSGSPSRLHDACLTLGSLTFMHANGSILFSEGAPTSLLPPGDLAHTLSEHSQQVCVSHGRQKNGERGEWQPFSRNDNYFSPLGLELCPVRSSSRLVHSLLQQHANADTRLCYVSTSTNSSHIVPKDITNTLRSNVARIGEAKLGVQARHVSAHSLRTGGGYCYHLSGVGDAALRLLGRWKSDAFISYIKAKTSKTGLSASLLLKEALQCKILFPFSRSTAPKNVSTPTTK